MLILSVVSLLDFTPALAQNFRIPTQKLIFDSCVLQPILQQGQFGPFFPWLPGQIRFFDCDIGEAAFGDEVLLTINAGGYSLVSAIPVGSGGGSGSIFVSLVNPYNGPITDINRVTNMPAAVILFR